jgi:hypothetical protein
VFLNLGITSKIFEAAATLEKYMTDMRPTSNFSFGLCLPFFGIRFFGFSVFRFFGFSVFRFFGFSVFIVSELPPLTH